MGIGFSILPGGVTQASTTNPAAPTANNAPNVGTPANNTGGVSLAAVVTANGFQPTNYVLSFFGTAATIAGSILWAYSSFDDKWRRLGTLPDMVIPNTNQAADTVVNAIGCYDRVAVSGTGTFGVIFIPLSVAGA